MRNDDGTTNTHAVPPRSERRVKADLVQVGLIDDLQMVGCTRRARCTAEVDGDELSLH